MLSMHPLPLFGITSRLAHSELRCIKHNLTGNKKNTINKCMPSSDVVMRRIADVVVNCFIWIYCSWVECILIRINCAYIEISMHILSIIVNHLLLIPLK